MTATGAEDVPHGDVFDYVVVGGGTAGSILASRLSEGGAAVCLLEAGPRDWNPLIHVPAGYIRNVYSKALTWGFETEASAGTGGRRLSLPQGRVLGGSSSINGLNYVRGQASDYDGWARDNPGWAWRDVLPYFMRSERRIGPGDDRVRGRDGELPVTDLDWHHPVCEAFIGGAAQLGIPRNPDYNSGDQAGTGYFQRTIKDGLRHSAARAFLNPARRRPNLAIRTGARATAILTREGRAVGVRYIRGGRADEPAVVYAQREVIVAAGAINTPRLLQLSGIGPAERLRGIGVTPLIDLPGVGENLRDHYGVRMVSRLKGVRTINNMVRGLPLGLEIARWLLRRPSVLAISPSLVHLFWSSIGDPQRPDLECVFTPASFREGVVGLLDRFPGVTLGVWQERPESRGHVRLRSADPFEQPLVDPRYLEAEVDRLTLLAGIRLGRRLLDTPALQPFLDHPVAPAAGLQSDVDLLDWARAVGTTVYHLVGTARMGRADDAGAVVDHELRLRGLAGLRIADASVMPTMPSGNTNAATMMIAEKAADLIHGRSLAPIDA